MSLSIRRVVGTLYALQVPIPYPMKTVTVLLDVSESGPVSLIDCAIDTPEARQTLATALAEFGLSFGDVERLIITHYHPDHYGLAGFFEEQGAAVCMLEYGRQGQHYWQHRQEWRPKHVEHLRNNDMPDENLQNLLVPRSSAEMNARSRVIPANDVQYLREGQELELAGRSWQVLWLAGHADGHLGLWCPEESLLIAGDSILPRISPHIGVHALFRPDPLGDYFQTLAKIKYLDPQKCVVGHFGPVMTNAQARADELREHHFERLDLLLDKIQQPMTAWQSVELLFKSKLNEAARHFALTESLAHLEHLRHQGRMQRLWDENRKVWLYSA